MPYCICLCSTQVFYLVKVLVFYIRFLKRAQKEQQSSPNFRRDQTYISLRINVSNFSRYPERPKLASLAHDDGYGRQEFRRALGDL